MDEISRLTDIDPALVVRRCLLGPTRLTTRRCPAFSPDWVHMFIDFTAVDVSRSTCGIPARRSPARPARYTHRQAFPSADRQNSRPPHMTYQGETAANLEEGADPAALLLTENEALRNEVIHLENLLREVMLQNQVLADAGQEATEDKQAVVKENHDLWLKHQACLAELENLNKLFLKAQSEVGGLKELAEHATCVEASLKSPHPQDSQYEREKVLDSDLRSLRRRYEALKLDQEISAVQRQELQDRLDCVEKSRSALAGEMKELAVSNRRLARDVEMLEEENSNFRKQVESLRFSHTELDGLRIAHANAVEKLEFTRLQLHTVLESRAEHVAQLNEALASLEDQRSRCVALQRQLQDSMTYYEEENAASSHRSSGVGGDSPAPSLLDDIIKDLQLTPRSNSMDEYEAGGSPCLRAELEAAKSYILQLEARKSEAAEEIARLRLDRKTVEDARCGVSCDTQTTADLESSSDMERHQLIGTGPSEMGQAFDILETSLTRVLGVARTLGGYDNRCNEELPTCTDRAQNFNGYDNKLLRCQNIAEEALLVLNSFIQSDLALQKSSASQPSRDIHEQCEIKEASLQRQISDKREQVRTLKAVLKANKSTFEVAMGNLRSRYDNEKASQMETISQLKRVIQSLQNEASAFNSLHALLSSKCEQYLTQNKELKENIAEIERDRESVNYLLSQAIHQKLELTQRLEEFEIARERLRAIAKRQSRTPQPGKALQRV